MKAVSLVNGKISDVISIYDRGLSYGQNLFETVAVHKGQPLLLEDHLSRLAQGCAALSIPLEQNLLRNEINGFCQSADKAVLRICITMGEGGRGYLNPQTPKANRILSLSQYLDLSTQQQEGITVGISEVRLSSQPLLAGLKHANRLEQVLARSQWQADWQEAVLLDNKQQVIEATQSNLFIVKEGYILTPDLSHCGVAGIMRKNILQCATQIGIQWQIVSLSIADLMQAEAVFLSNCIMGICPVKELQKQTYNDFSVSQQLRKELIKYGAIPSN